ncbi:hypothetical protein F4805DRAFT_387758 [Annulohypoxylon moriforme]|nr:hypothetical protein F4805DRAFT_387758 [Annulohypoxylon moriforme]
MEYSTISCYNLLPNMTDSKEDEQTAPQLPQGDAASITSSSLRGIVDGDTDSEEEMGDLSEVKHLYSHGPDPSGKIVWMQSPPGGINPTLGRVQRTANAGGIGITHYHQIDLTTDRIEIRDPTVKEFICKVLSGYPGFLPGVPELKLHPPFIEFLHYWDRFQQMEKEITDQRLKRLVRYLKNILAEGLEGSFKALHDLEKTGYINYENVLVPFKRREVVIQSDKGVLTAAIVGAAELTGFGPSRKNCVLRVWLLTWNGSVFGMKQGSWTIPEFDGYRKVTDLEISPLKCHQNQDEIRQILIKRGRRFESLCGQHIMRYNGYVCDGEKSIALSERIIVDVKAYYEFQDFLPPELQLTATELSKIPLKILQPGERYVLAPPRIWGFSLGKKDFFEFNIDNISPVMWNDRLFGNLVLDKQEKEMLLALVTHSTEGNDDGFDDFLEGKGKLGLLIII